MARHTIKPGRQEREANQPQRRKSARISSAHEVFNRHVPKLASPVHRPVHRPVREAPNAKDVRNLKREKIRQTVSTAGMFKKKLKVNPHDEKHHRHREVREPTPEPDFVTDFRDGVDIARDALSAKAKATFDDAHDALSERLMVSKGADGSFFQELAEAAATLSAPLIHEKIETTTSRDGKRKIEVVEIGKRVATFKKFVEKEESKLKESWRHWEELQTEYIELGIEVFGPEVFGEAAAGLKIKQKDFKREMELLDFEHNARIEEFDEEIEDTGPKLLQKMKASEKELDSAAKKEQARLLQALIQG